MNFSDSLEKSLVLDSTLSRGEMRRRFLDGLSADLNTAMASGSTLAVLLIDLQRFAMINRAIGYDAGDEVLIYVQKIIAENIPKASIIGRLGDNQFGLIIPDLKSAPLITLAVEKIRTALKQPMQFNGEDVSLDCHAGYALYPKHMLDANMLLMEAEASLFRAKLEGTGSYFDEQPDKAEKPESWRLEKHLKRALDSNSLTFYYQPKVDVNTLKPIGMESLVRWHSDELGIILPDEFIPLAEQTTLINEITQWAIKTALREKQGFDKVYPGLSVSVNVSSTDIYDKNLIANLQSALGIWAIEAESLTLEVTESVLLENTELALKQLHQARDLGVKISIDDFGTGFSSLAYFKDLPADELKIDKSFITNLCNNADDVAIVEFIIALAHKFNIYVVAEGVEDKDTFERLKSLGCDYVQGHYFSKPLPQRDFISWLLKNK
jgi:diguanylate cyclase (GGDEF)-like protein